jgi:hypothetical protein
VGRHLNISVRANRQSKTAAKKQAVAKRKIILSHCLKNKHGTQNQEIKPLSH